MRLIVFGSYLIPPTAAVLVKYPGERHSIGPAITTNDFADEMHSLGAEPCANSQYSRYKGQQGWPWSSVEDNRYERDERPSNLEADRLTTQDNVIETNNIDFPARRKDSPPVRM